MVSRSTATSVNTKGVRSQKVDAREHIPDDKRVTLYARTFFTRPEDIKEGFTPESLTGDDFDIPERPDPCLMCGRLPKSDDPDTQDELEKLWTAIGEAGSNVMFFLCPACAIGLATSVLVTAPDSIAQEALSNYMGAMAERLRTGDTSSRYAVTIGISQHPNGSEDDEDIFPTDTKTISI